MSIDTEVNEDLVNQIAEAYRRDFLIVPDHLWGIRLFLRRMAAHCGAPVPHADKEHRTGRGTLQWGDEFAPYYRHPDFAAGTALAYAKMLAELISNYRDRSLRMNRDIHSESTRLSIKICTILGDIRAHLELFVKHDATIARARVEDGSEDPWVDLSDLREAFIETMSVNGERLEQVWMQYQEAYNQERCYIPDSDRISIRAAVSLVIDELALEAGPIGDKSARKRIDTKVSNGLVRSNGTQGDRFLSKSDLEIWLNSSSPVDDEEDDVNNF